jgi:hypothetical protein
MSEMRVTFDQKGREYVVYLNGVEIGRCLKLDDVGLVYANTSQFQTEAVTAALKERSTKRGT